MAHRFEVVLGGAFRAIDLLDRVTDQGGERSTSPQRGGIQGTPLLVGQRDLSSLHDVSLHHFLSGLEHLEAFPHVRRVRIRETTAHHLLLARGLSRSAQAQSHRDTVTQLREMPCVLLHGT